MVRLNDALLARISLVLAVFGVAALGLLAEVQKPVDADISELGGLDIGSRVSVKGSVAEIFKARNALVFTVYDGNFVKAVVFSPSEEEKEIVRKGNIVEVRGRLQNYKGEIEIIAEKILGPG